MAFQPLPTSRKTEETRLGWVELSPWLSSTSGDTHLVILDEH